MNNLARFLTIALCTLSIGTISNLASAEPDSDWQNGMGPGMMGGYGPGSGYGPGYGMGPGMMGGYGYGYGMGPGMMGFGDYYGLNLSSDQKTRISQIRKEMRDKQWPLMGQMMDARDKLRDLYDMEKQDATAIDKQYQAIDALRRQMVDNAVSAHNRINSILTKEQRDKQHAQGWGYGPMMRGWGDWGN